MQVSSQEDSLRTQMGNYLSVGDSTLYAETAFKLFGNQARKGNTKEALETLREALEIAPKGDKVYYEIKSNYLIQSFYVNGSIKANLHMLDTAIVCIKMFKSTNSKIAGLHMYAGQFYETHGDFSKAKNHYAFMTSNLIVILN